MLATRPAIAFIVDIRRGNLLEHLMQGAHRALGGSRGVSLAAVREEAPANVGPKSSAADLFRAFDQISTTEGLHRQNLSDIETQLTKRHGFALSAEDLQQIEGIYFRSSGTARTSATRRFRRGRIRGSSAAAAGSSAATFPATRS
jgi:hypothetical protein